MATYEDVNWMATYKDINWMATYKDINQMATGIMDRLQDVQRRQNLYSQK